MSAETSSLDCRVSKLERTNRLLLIACICMTCLAFLMAADASENFLKGKRVTAEEFHLTDSKGEIRATLSLNDIGGAELVLSDTEGKTRVMISANGGNQTAATPYYSNSPVLVLLSKNEKIALLAGTNHESGIGSVDFQDEGVQRGGVGGSALHKK